MIAVPVFDVDALRQYEGMAMPADFERQHALFNQMKNDLEAAADQIEIQDAALLEARAQTKGFQ
jgi:hypothetical protein